MIKSDFDTSRLFKMDKYGILKEKQVSSSILNVWNIWLQNCKTHPLEEGCIRKALLYTVLMIKSDFWHFQAVSNGQIWYMKKKQVSSSILKVSQISLQFAKHTPEGCHMEEKPYFILFWWLKVIFDTSRLFKMVKYGIFKRKLVYSSILKVWQIWLHIAIHTPNGGGHMEKKALFYTVLMIKSDFWHFQAVSNGQIWYMKKSKSLAPYWRFHRSEVQLQNIPHARRS